MCTTAIRRGILISLGLAATLTMAACSPTRPPNSAGSSTGQTVPAVASPTPTAAPRLAVVPPASAWLAPSEIPYGATYSWSLFIGTANGAPIGTSEGHGVYYVAPDTVFQAITSCGDPSLMLSQTLGAWQRLFRPTTGMLRDQAGQWISSYPDAAAAQAAWQRLQGAYSGCRAEDPNPQITITETAQRQDGMAWFHSTHGLVPDLAPYIHEYFVLHANQIAYVFVQGGGSALAATPNDAQILATIAQHLNA
jgi:hypothetical protein